MKRCKTTLSRSGIARGCRFVKSFQMLGWDYELAELAPAKRYDGLTLCATTSSF
jgi:hypothetical protein